jgi:hypothetical protein
LNYHLSFCKFDRILNLYQVVKTAYSIILIFFLFFNHFSFAQEDVEKHPLLTDRFIFNGGVFFINKDLIISVDGQDPSDEIELGQAFNLKNFNRTSTVGFDWKFAKKWWLSSDFFSFTQVKTIDLDEPIEWEDYTFDGEAKLGVGVGVLKVMVGRVFSQGDKHNLGVGLGAHTMLLDFYIEGEASLEGPDGGIETGIQKGDVSATVPLPNIGLWYNWAPTPKWYFKSSVNWLYIGIGDYKGWLWDLTAGVKYQIVDFFGVGINYKYYSVELEVDKVKNVSTWKGNVHIAYNGPMFLVHFNF